VGQRVLPGRVVEGIVSDSLSSARLSICLACGKHCDLDESLAASVCPEDKWPVVMKRLHRKKAPCRTCG